MERVPYVAFTLVTLSRDSDLHAVHVGFFLSFRLSFISDVPSPVTLILLFISTSLKPADSSIFAPSPYLLQSRSNSPF